MKNKFNVSFKNLVTAFESKSDKDLMKAHHMFYLMSSQSMTNVGTFFINIAFKFKFPVKFLIKNTVFSHFCGGESLVECSSTIKSLQKYKIGTIADYSVEGEKTEEGFKSCMMEILETIKKASEESGLPFAVFKATGIGSFDLFEKVQKQMPLSQYEKREFENFKSRFETICREAYLNSVKILIDAEESWIQNVIDELTQNMMLKYNREKPIVYNTFQMYRKDRLDALRKCHEHAKGKYIVGVKLVRGAYLEKETEYAADNMIPNPIHRTKEDTDRSFNQALEFILERIEDIAICCGTHNENSNYRMLVKMGELGIASNHAHIHFAQLFGMSDNITYTLAKAGFNVAKYVPYGPVESVMPYLIRRAQENTAVSGQTSRELRLIKAEIQRRKLIKENKKLEEINSNLIFQTNALDFQDR